jgi:hypothetical protein
MEQPQSGFPESLSAKVHKEGFKTEVSEKSKAQEGRTRLSATVEGNDVIRPSYLLFAICHTLRLA